MQSLETLNIHLAIFSAKLANISFKHGLNAEGIARMRRMMERLELETLGA